MTYPIIPFTGKWGADIPLDGGQRPEWLLDGQVCAIKEQDWLGVDIPKKASKWVWGASSVTAIRLPAERPRYAKDAASETCLETPSYETQLRDKAALAALTGLLANPISINHTSEHVAECAWKNADAFMAARKEVK